MSHLTRLAKLEEQHQRATEPTYPPLYMPPKIPVDDGRERCQSATQAKLFLTAIENRDKSDDEIVLLLSTVTPLDKPLDADFNWFIRSIREMTPEALANREMKCLYELDYFAKHGTRFDGWGMDYDHALKAYMYEPLGGWDVGTPTEA